MDGGLNAGLRICQHLSGETNVSTPHTRQILVQPTSLMLFSSCMDLEPERTKSSSDDLAGPAKRGDVGAEIARNHRRILSNLLRRAVRDHQPCVHGVDAVT